LSGPFHKIVIPSGAPSYREAKGGDFQASSKIEQFHGSIVTAR
jgi:hypothetical protein